MKVTFMIGNGFDLRMGMNTRYTDMYDSYVHTYSDDAVIREFQRILQLDSYNRYKNWGDFELAMAQYASYFTNEEDFIKCVRHFKSHMVKHLRKEESDFIEYVEKVGHHYEICANVMKDALRDFYKGQTPNVVYEIDSISSDGFREYNFISFNYTKVFDYLLDRYESYNDFISKTASLHIHGSLEGDVVLGIDNEMQIENVKFPITRRIERAFIKPKFNAAFDNNRILSAKRIIDESDVICIYGMSLGMSDKSWIDAIAAWLLADENHHLVYFQYSEDVFNNWNSDEKMDEEDDRKRVLLERLFILEGDIDLVYDRVHIPVGFDIFDVRERLDVTKMASA